MCKRQTFKNYYVNTWKETVQIYQLRPKEFCPIEVCQNLQLWLWFCDYFFYFCQILRYIFEYMLFYAYTAKNVMSTEWPDIFITKKYSGLSMVIFSFWNLRFWN